MRVTQAEGYNGIVKFDGASVVIERTGLAARVLIGSGSKSIPVGQITAVQMVPAKLGFRGFIQFTIAGGIEQRATLGHRTKEAHHDENTVVFNRHQQLAFQELRAAIEAAMFATTTHADSRPSDLPDQLRHLAELRDSGAISESEFEAAKTRLLA